MTEEQIKNRLTFSLILLAVTAVFVLVGQTIYIGDLRHDRDAHRLALRISMNVTDVTYDYLQYTIAAQERAHAEIAILKTELLRTKMIDRIRRINPRAPADRIVNAVFKAADHTSLPPALILAKLEIESHYNPRAVSRTGARGLAQIVRSTAAELGLPWDQAFNVEQSVFYGAIYLKSRIERAGNIHDGLGHYNGWDDPDYSSKVFRVKASLEVPHWCNGRCSRSIVEY